MKFKQWLLPVIIIALAFGLGKLLVALRDSPPKRPPVDYSAAVEVLPIHLSPLTLTVESQGTVQPKQRMDLISEVSGSVIWVAKALVEGGRVEQGQVLLHIDPMSYQVAVAEAKASLAQANLNLKDEQAEYKRGAAYRGGKSSNLRQHKLAQVEAEYNSALERVKKAEQDLLKTHITAPFDAVINEKAVEIGQYVAAGNRLFTLLGTQTAEVRLPITAAEISYIRPEKKEEQQTAPTVDLSASFGSLVQHWPAKLVRLENRVDEDTRVFYVVAEIENPYALNTGPLPLSVGLFVEAHIEGDRIDNAVRIPYSALHESNQVYAVVDGRIERRVVTVFRREKQSAVITDGLKEGDQVVLTRLDLMVDGMSVTVVNKPDETLQAEAPQTEPVVNTQESE